MGKKRGYTDEEFRLAMVSSTSMRQALSKLGLKPAGGNYRVAKIRAANLGIDLKHFLGKGWNKGKKATNKKPLEILLVKNSSYQSFKLKNRLLEEEIFERKCYNCGLKEWLGKIIPLELEHKNGDSTDNRLENLTLLCPNCHSFTNTYRGRNKRES